MKRETKYLGLGFGQAFLGLVHSVLDVLAEIVIYKFERNLNAGLASSNGLGIEHS
jgi:hypothetical protein